jgi:hypothetical protein
VTLEIVWQWSAGQGDQRETFLGDFAVAESAFRAVSLSLLGNFLRMLGPQPPLSEKA